MAEVVALEQPQQAQRPQRSAAELRDKLVAIAGRLGAEATRRVGQRNDIETRWLEDVRQYHSKYEDSILADLKAGGKSQLFIGITRAKTDAMEARLSDMLFPTDDKNWGIQPTPVPELTAQAQEAARTAQAAKDQAAAMPAGSPDQAGAQQVAQAHQDKADALNAVMAEAEKRSKAMEAEIEDQLTECRYSIECREAIRDACRLGTGIMKGPVLAGRNHCSWKPQQVAGPNDTTVTVHTLTENSAPRPAFFRVDPWAFFPDMDARSVEDSEGFYERHLMNAKHLRKLSTQPGFDPDAIRRLLREQPKESVPQYLADLRTIVGLQRGTLADRYLVWEYHGPLTAEEMQDLAEATGQSDMVDGGDEESDPLQEMQATVWFCQNEVLKFGIHPLDSGDPLYSVFNLAKDEASVFGYGIPYIIRDSQKAINGAWRMMMDNGGFSTAPQIVINQEQVEPADGSWNLKGGKVWLKKSTAPQGVAVFEVYNIDGHQAELANIVEMARRNIDEESNLPIIAQGEQGAHVTQTAQGMSILMNSVNVVFRRVVKNFDDDMTTPNIRRIYDWNMQFSTKDTIKGDYDVDARGTSVLLVREMQAQNLMTMASAFTGHPVLGPLTKAAPLYRRLVQAHMLPADEIVLTDDEIAQAAAQEQANPTPNPEVMKIEAQYNITKLELDAKKEIATMERDTAMMKLAAQQNMTLDSLRAMLAKTHAETASKERIFAAEAALTPPPQPPVDPGRAEKPQPHGGGYL